MLKYMHLGAGDGEEEFFTYGDTHVKDSTRLWPGHGPVFNDAPQMGLTRPHYILGTSANPKVMTMQMRKTGSQRGVDFP